LHTRPVGRLAALPAVLVIAAGALPAPVRADDDFWQAIAEPHADQVRALVERAGRLMTDASSFLYADQDPTGAGRVRRLDEAYRLLRRARELSPANPDVLCALGRAADESGRTAAAVEAFIACLERQTTAAAEIHLRLGTLYLRQGDRDAAVQHLRTAEATRNAYVAAAAVVHLAALLEDTGRTGQAIAALEGFATPVASGYGNGDVTLVAFALAVAYDRDEQLTSAWHALDRLQSGLGGGYGGQVLTAMAALRLVPAVDVHYWQALLYESLGKLTEARAEWLHYAAGGEAARFRDRALAHVAGIDRLLAGAVGARRPPARGIER